MNQPDFRTISEFRRRHLDALAALFVQVLVLCQRAGLVGLGDVAVDGTKLRANASEHKAMLPPHCQRCRTNLARARSRARAIISRIGGRRHAHTNDTSWQRRGTGRPSKRAWVPVLDRPGLGRSSARPVAEPQGRAVPAGQPCFHWTQRTGLGTKFIVIPEKETGSWQLGANGWRGD